MECIITGKVIHGNEIGRRIGFPTANILLSNDLTLKNGVYAARVQFEQKVYDALVNIGCKPTVTQAGARLLEAHLLAFDGELYGKRIEVQLIEFIRPEEKFGSIEALQQQIEKDKQKILEILHHAD